VKIDFDGSLASAVLLAAASVRAATNRVCNEGIITSAQSDAVFDAAIAIIEKAVVPHLDDEDGA
jgi:hypothetical protein